MVRIAPSMSEDAYERDVLSILADLGWVTVSGPDIAPLEAGETATGRRRPERSDYRETILEGRLADAIRRFNPHLPETAVVDAVATVRRVESPVVEPENWRCYRYLVEGVPVEYRDEAGALRTARARIVDFKDPDANDLAAVSQFSIRGPRKTRRPDVILFVNGLPMALFELKRPHKSYARLDGAYRQVQTYRNQVGDLFRWNQFVVLADGGDAICGSFSAPWEHFAQWKTINGEDVDTDRLPPDEVLINGMCRPDVFFDLIRNCIATYGEGDRTVKKVARYHQYWAVRKAVDCTIDAVAGDGRAGVVWHTQGSGKSLEMAYYAGKMMRHPAMGNPTLIVLTDRNDLDEQLYDDTFASSKPGSPLPEAPVQAESRANLKELLSGRESGGIVFTTIQKFGLSKTDREAGRSFEVLSDRRNIVVMVDEAHRSNYDLIDGFARHLRDGLPNASFIGFTGTPIEQNDRSTRAIFGEYIDVYDMTQAQADGATVKVYYEPRLAKVDMPDEARDLIDEEVAAASAGQDEDSTERAKSKWARVEAIVGSEERIKELAADIVEHWETRKGVINGKAMIVAMSRRIAVDLHDEIVALRPDWRSDENDEGVIKVVITGDATDPLRYQSHIRNKSERRAIKARACDAKDPLEIVIVRDMWLTGFDSPPMHTMYVDKPMQGVGLMQAITRVNRKFGNKPGGLVVDYIGIAENLRKALADYTNRDKQGKAAGEELSETALPSVLSEHDIVGDILAGTDWVSMTADKSDRARVRAVYAATNYLLRQEPEVDGDGSGEFASDADEATPRQRFMAHCGRLVRLFSLVATLPEARAIRDDVAFFDAVRQSLMKVSSTERGGHDGDAALDTAVRQIVSEHVSGSGVVDIYAEAGMEQPDLSLIDDSFMERYSASEHKNVQLEMLKQLLAKEVKTVERRNIVAGRQFSEMLAEALNKYHNRGIDQAEVMRALVELAKRMREQVERGEETGLNEKELAFYDALRTNEGAQQAMADETMRQIAHELTKTVQRDAKTDWNVKDQVRAKLRAGIKRLLLRYDYPPDGANEATDLILAQVELQAGLEVQGA